jgi:hypothetical protein
VVEVTADLVVVPVDLAEEEDSDNNDLFQTIEEDNLLLLLHQIAIITPERVVND